MAEPLFWSHDGHQVRQNQIQAAVAEVAHLSERQVLDTDPSEMVAYTVAKHAIEVPVLDLDNITADRREITYPVEDHFSSRRVNVPGVAYSFEIPFAGDRDLFLVRPGSFDSAPPRADVGQRSIVFSVTGRDLSTDDVKRALEEMKASLAKYLGWHKDLWEEYNRTVGGNVARALEERRQRLQKQQGVEAGLESLGVKLKEKAGDPRAYTPAAIKQKIVPKMPAMKPGAKPDSMLRTTKLMARYLALSATPARTIEQSSSRTRALEEEAQRDMLMVPLNAHFGTAAAEAFNQNGKTDIVVKHQGGNLFVAECKIWSGPKALGAAVDQLLSHLTWRDTKAVLIFFSRNAGFNSVVEQLRDAPREHAQYLSGPVKLDESSFQFRFKLPQDAARHITLTVMGFDLSAR